MVLVGLPRIELGLHEPESCVLPVYYSPCDRSAKRSGAAKSGANRVDPARIELAPLQCECSVVPLNYGPAVAIFYHNSMTMHEAYFWYIIA